MALWHSQAACRASVRPASPAVRLSSCQRHPCARAGRRHLHARVIVPVARCEAAHHDGGKEKSDRMAVSSRRSLLGLPVGLGLASTGAGLAPAYAGEATQELPKQYLKLAPKLVDSMLASLELEEEGASEFEVRRKADEAKPLVKEFVAKWKADSRLAGDKSQDEIKEAMRELADHYMKNGQRTPLPRSVVDSVRKHLLTAREALPEVEEKGGFLGLGL